MSEINRGEVMAEIKYPEDPESLWMVSRTAIVTEAYFETESEAREFARGLTGSVVDAPVPEHQRIKPIAPKEKPCQK